MYLNKCYYFELPINQRILFSSLIIIQNVSWAVNKHIGNISEGLCDTDMSTTDMSKYTQTENILF